MKNEKGFTLIELMAVIIILAVMALIVTPLIIGSIKGSKEKLYETQLENIKSAAKSYMIDLEIEDGNKITLTLGELKKVGYVKKDIKNPKTGEQFNDCLLVSVTRTGDLYEYEITDSEETNCDETSDIVMLLFGSINETATFNKTYKEPGVMVKNLKGQSLDSSKIKVEIKQKKDGNLVRTLNGNYTEIETLIDTSDYYNYEITYIYDEIEGKVSKTRNVTVKDANNLQCLIVPTTANEGSGWITQNRQAKILSINTNKKVQYSLSTTNNKNYSNNQIIDVARDGEVKLYGYIKDEFENESACINVLKYEVGNPSCSINLSGTKLSSGWYTSNVVASLKTKLISPIEKNGMSLNNSQIYNGKTSIQMSSSGTSYGYIKDVAKKDASCNSGFVKIDKTTSIIVKIAGTIEGTSTVYTSGSRINKNIELTSTINPSTTVSGYSYQWYKDGVAIPDGTSKNYTAEESGNYYMIATTGSGVVGKSNTINVIIIKVKPSCNISLSGRTGENEWYLGNVTATLNWKESVIVSKDITLSSTKSYGGNTNLTVTGSGEKGVYGYVKDEFGQEANCYKPVALDVATISNKITATIAGTSTAYDGKFKNQNIALTSTLSPYPVASGYTYQWYKDNVAIPDGTSKDYEASTSGNYYMVATTGSGVVGKSNEINVKIDKDPPIVTYNIAGGIYSEYKTVRVTATDDNFDFMHVRVYKDNVIQYEKSVSDLQNTSYSVSLDSDGTWVVYTQAYDKAGNIQNQSPDNGEGWYYQSYIIDTSVANASLTAKNTSNTLIISGSWANTELSMTLSGTNGYDFYYCIDVNNTCTPNTKYSGTFTHGTSGTRYIRYKASKIIAGTTTKKESSIGSYTALIDKTRPTVTYSIPGGGYNGYKTVTVTATDDNFSYMHVYVYKDGSKVSNKTVNQLTQSTYTVSLDSDGTWGIYTKAYDKAGNKQNQSPYNSDGWYYQSYIIDTSVPEATLIAKDTDGQKINSGSWATTNLLITLNVKNGKDLYYCIDETNTCTPNIKYSSTFTHSISGTRYIRYKATKTISGMTKESSVGSYIAKVDIEGLRCEIELYGTAGNNGWYVSDVLAQFINYNQGDTFYMSSNYIENYAHGGVTYGTTNRLRYLTSSSEQQTVYGYLQSILGQHHTVCSRSFKIDTTPPIINSFEVTTTNSGKIQLKVNANDAESGISKYEFYKDNNLIYSTETSSNTISIEIEQNSKLTAKYKVVVYNNAGLDSSKELSESCSESTRTSCDTVTCSSEGIDANGLTWCKEKICNKISENRVITYSCNTGRQYSISEACSYTMACIISSGGGSCSCPSGASDCQSFCNNANCNGVDAFGGSCTTSGQCTKWGCVAN